jgi:gluconate 2-dehydrogenase gamma chain
MADISRRAIIKGSGAGAASAAMMPVIKDELRFHDPSTKMAAPGDSSTAAAGTTSQLKTTYLFFNDEEAAFIEAAVARLIPKDEQSGGALEAGVPNYMDKQLGGAWGAGERLYRGGPWQKGTPTQGYQLPFAPAEFFHTALGAINRDLATAGTPFANMTDDQQDAYLKKLEAGGQNLDGVPSEQFFAQLWALTLEGYFSDPVYGGNRNMVSWRMIGFPGAYASYYDIVDQHGIKLDRPPTSLGEDLYRHIHIDPNIPAYAPSNNR